MIRSTEFGTVPRTPRSPVESTTRFPSLIKDAKELIRALDNRETPFGVDESSNPRLNSLLEEMARRVQATKEEAARGKDVDTLVSQFKAVSGLLNEAYCASIPTRIWNLSTTSIVRDLPSALLAVRSRLEGILSGMIDAKTTKAMQAELSSYLGNAPREMELSAIRLLVRSATLAPEVKTAALKRLGAVPPYAWRDPNEGARCKAELTVKLAAKRPTPA